MWLVSLVWGLCVLSFLNTCVECAYRHGVRLSVQCPKYNWVLQDGVNEHRQLIIPLYHNRSISCRLILGNYQLMIAAQFQDSTTQQTIEGPHQYVCSFVMVQNYFKGENLCAAMLRGAVDMRQPTFTVDYTGPQDLQWQNVYLIVTAVEYTHTSPCRRLDRETYGDQCCYRVANAARFIQDGNLLCDGNRCIPQETICDCVPTCLDRSDEGVWCTPVWVWVYVALGALCVVVGIPAIVVGVVRSRRAAIQPPKS